MRGWHRINRRSCGFLALFALALQLYLSFGHIHAEELGISRLAGTSAHAQPRAGDLNPPFRHGDGDEHGICSICAALSLTASSVLPAIAPLPLPIATDWAWLTEVQSPQPLIELPANFRARAPPHA
jgi:hypothetical protein